MKDLYLKSMCSRKNGFTLVEVILASMIGAFVALVAVGTLKSISAGAEMVDNNIEAAAEIRFASRTIATDLVNLYRDRNPKNTKLVGTVEATGMGVVSSLTLYTVGRIKARIDQPEGDVYEVEYYLVTDEQKSALYRRLWPNPDKQAQPGGILSVIAEGIDVFKVRFFDGQEWQIEWPEQMQSLPELVEVTIAAKRRSRADAAMESFVVNFARSPKQEAGTFATSASAQSE